LLKAANAFKMSSLVLMLLVPDKVQGLNLPRQPRQMCAKNESVVFWTTRFFAREKGLFIQNEEKENCQLP
jgi:hypothetical protein